MIYLSGRTLKNHIKTGSIKKKLGRYPVFTEAQEKDLAERIKRFAKIGIQLTPKVIRRLAYQLCKAQHTK